VKDFVCNGCSLLCNDVSATIEKNEVSSLGVCKLGHAHLTSAASEAETGIVRRNGEEKLLESFQREKIYSYTAGPQLLMRVSSMDNY